MSLKFFTTILILLIAIAETYSAVLSTPFIFGGDKATANQFPFLVSFRLKIGTNYVHVCGASILSDRIVITAAHCIEPDLKVTDYSISVGAHTKDEQGALYAIKEFIVHPNHKLPTPNDIALMTLDKPIRMSENITNIEINRNFIDENVDAVIAGWGKSEDEFTGLKYAVLKTITNGECRRLFPTAIFEDFGTLCAYSGEEGTGVCSGDSGSPLISNNKLIGITSWSSNPCAEGKPDGFARISDYADWIETVKNLEH